MKHISIALFALTLLFATGCNNEGTHKLRLQNDADFVVRTVNVGALSFNDVKPGTATDYKEIPEGSYDVTGDFEATVTIEGRGNNNWSLKVAKNGDVQLVNDK